MQVKTWWLQGYLPRGPVDSCAQGLLISDMITESFLLYELWCFSIKNKSSNSDVFLGLLMS